MITTLVVSSVSGRSVLSSLAAPALNDWTLDDLDDAMCFFDGRAAVLPSGILSGERSGGRRSDRAFVQN